MKLSKIALYLILGTGTHSVWADTSATEDNYVKAVIGSMGRIYGETYYGSPNSIAGCRILADNQSKNVQWIRTTTNVYAPHSTLYLFAREGDFVQVYFDYKGVDNVCWTPEDAITWDTFVSPPPKIEMLYADNMLIFVF